MSHHLWQDYVFGTWEQKMFSLGPAIPMYVILVILSFGFIMYNIIEWLKSQYEFFYKNFTYLEIEDVEEGFDRYFKSINHVEIGWTSTEEKRCRDKFKYATMPEYVFNEYNKTHE
jgi:hypothetical protein